MAISKRLRFEILRRDEHCCRYCGEHASPDVKLTVDHVLPVALGGTDDPANLVAACGPCNSGKSASSPDAPLVAQVTEDAMRWAEAISVAQTAALVELEERDEYVNFIDNHWEHGHNLFRTPSRPDNWPDSIDIFRKRGLPIGLLTDAASKALRASRVTSGEKWRYFMGVAWSMVSEMEADAKRYYEYVGAKRSAQ